MAEFVVSTWFAFHADNNQEAKALARKACSEASLQLGGEWDINDVELIDGEETVDE